MKEIRDLTPADLVDEGRRWVNAPGEYFQGHGFRATAIFENHPFRYAIGEISNLPNELSRVSYIPADDDSMKSRDLASETAMQWCMTTEGLSKLEYFSIVASSMQAHHQGKYVKVLGDDPDHLTLQNGFGDEIKVDEEAAYKLYQDLAKTLDLPYQRNCPKCGELADGDKCDDCGESDADE